MKYYLLICLFVSLSSSCITSNNKSLNKQKASAKNNVVKSHIEKQESVFLDTLSINQVKFNKESFYLNYHTLRKKRKDSMIISEWDCGHPFEWKNDTVDFWSYHTENLEYITNKEESILYSGKFNGNKLLIKNIDVELTEHTTINDFKSIFANSYKSFIQAKKLNPENYTEYDYVNVAFTINQPEDHWIFYFNKEGFLVKFELYWWLC
ncbi:hypothetical protein [Aquimarina sp. RZ0]|uniref:hypothetical protein n=1 Tax=Aquimarina sp. RZ0 TaxID=2607730 RepID=UPI0011F38B97|nr:hypothetical protein [Aquimarina sp. RZ0]KAA1242361.1 hypothetical protein F0000_25965 [Aquimarina sp. RZ0]